MGIRILMLGWELPPRINGGLGMACAGLRRAMWKSGAADVSFVIPRLFGGESLQEGPLRALLPAGESPRDKNSYLADANAFAESVSKLDEGADLIHAHDWLTAQAGLALKARLNIPLVLHIHSTEYDRSGPLADDAIVAIERAGMDGATYIVAVSEATRSQIVRRYGQSPDKVITVHNGVDLPDAPQRVAGLPLVTFAGRLTWQKGPLCFIEAAYRMLLAEPALRFVMAGDGEMLSDARNLAHDLGLAQRMTFPGFLDRAGVVSLLAESTVFVMPSIAEPFGIVALEAMAVGVPVVTSRNAGVTEVVRSVIGVEPGDAAAVAEATLRLIRDPVGARNLATAAQQVVQHLNWATPTKKLLDIYRACITGARGSIHVSGIASPRPAVTIAG